MSRDLIGTSIAHYRVTAHLGEGGMGEVWRATDTRLGRDVAIKLLPDSFAQDAERLGRFEREAQLLAQLHHPHIASIFGLEEFPGGRALVMELVEGPTLAERLAAGPLPLAEALSIARQIAEALEEAHEKGIVHRDLKPQNIKAPVDGPVKVLDFGLAKAMEPVAGGSGDPRRSPTLQNSPTLTGAGTQLGVILGTAAYMAPEQARGGVTDKRADIWAFGVVLHEMITGRSLFAGETVSDTLAGVLKTEIDLGALPAGTPPAIRRLLRRSLERNPKNRLHDIADARLVIDEVIAGRTDDPAPVAAAAPAPAARSSWRLAAGLVAGLLLGRGAAAIWMGRSPHPVASATPRPSFRQLTKLPGGEGHPAIAPDGQSFVYAKRDGGDVDLFVQRVDGSKSVPLTADCESDDFDPAFSPDGRSIAYRSECGAGIFVMGATGESRRRVADFGFQPAWSPDGRELALVTERLDSPTSRNSKSELWAVRVDTGERRRITEHDAMGPSWSPDGHRIAIWGLKGRSFQRDLWTVAADGSAPSEDAAVPLVDDPALDWEPVYSGDGRWLYFISTRGGTFNYWRLAIDPRSGERRGEPEPVTAPSSWTGPFSLSADGHRLVFQDLNLDTAILRAPLDLGRQEFASPPTTAFSGSFVLREQTISPDGSWLLFTNEDLPQELHLVHPDGSGYRQLTEGDRNRQGDFSPDGEWIVFQTTRGNDSLAVMHPDGGGWQPLPVGPGKATPRWSPDGSTISMYDNNADGGQLVDLRPGFGAATVHPLPRISADVLFWPTAWSTDSKLLAGRATRQGQIEDIVIRDMTSGEYRALSRTSGAPGDFNMVFVDPRHVAYTDARALWLRDVFGGEAKKLYAPGAGRHVTNLSATADGRWLTWIERADESDIWLMTLDEPTAGTAAAK
jgi:Tol biopolymer transport system component